MKAIKALKRLTKAEALLSNVIERYVASGHSIQEVLQDAKASVIRAKDAVGLQASHRKSKKPSVKAGRPKRRRSAAIKGTTESPSHATPKPANPKRRISEEGMKRIIAATKKRWRLQKAEAAKAKPAATKKTVSKKAARKKAVAKKVAKTLTKTVAKKSAPTKRAAVKTAPASSQATTGAAAPQVE
jgi:hypothetical protein